MDNQIAKNKPKSSSAKRIYLLGYNGLAMALWTVLVGRALVVMPFLIQQNSLHQLIRALWPLHLIAQGVALLEVVHAVFGIVRASPVTTAMQVASRILVVFGVLYPFPQIVITTNIYGRDQPGTYGGVIAFAALIVAHGVTEVIRYGFFVWNLGIGEKTPGFLIWLRYNTFFVLYPLGISSECWLMYEALPFAKNFATIPMYDLILKGVLLIYIPGSYILYTHMMSQRRKVLKGKGKQA